LVAAAAAAAFAGQQNPIELPGQYPKIFPSMQVRIDARPPLFCGGRHLFYYCQTSEEVRIMAIILSVMRQD
jgi:hypothetical protein